MLEGGGGEPENPNKVNPGETKPLGLYYDLKARQEAREAKKQQIIADGVKAVNEAAERAPLSRNLEFGLKDKWKQLHPYGDDHLEGKILSNPPAGTIETD
jgi:hypothetical protein